MHHSTIEHEAYIHIAPPNMGLYVCHENGIGAFTPRDFSSSSTRLQCLRWWEKFRCIPCDVSTHTTSLSVSGRPPLFVVAPQTTFTSPTSRLRLNCTADGDPAPTITWYRGSPLQPLTAFNGSVVNGTLIITNVTDGVDSSSAGVQYQCRASNSFGTILSKTINVFTSCKLSVMWFRYHGDKSRALVCSWILSMASILLLIISDAVGIKKKKR